MRLLVMNLATDVKHPALGFAHDLLNAFAHRVEDVQVLTMTIGTTRLPSNVSVMSLGQERGFSQPRRLVRFYRCLLNLTRGNRVDVCFAHMAPLFAGLAGPVLAARAVPMVLWYGHPSVTWRLKVADRFSRRIVTNVATAYPYRNDRLTAVGCGIDENLFRTDPCTIECPGSILCVGRISPSKRLENLIEAAALLSAKATQGFTVTFLGPILSVEDDQYLGSLRAKATHLGIGNIIRFEQGRPRYQLPDVYRSCSVHVNLTPTGFGDKVAVEAMACGRPSVLANEGFRETLGDHASDLLFTLGDVAALAERLHRLLAMTVAERANLGVELSKRAIRFHGLEGVTDRLMRVFTDVLSRPFQPLE